jgi:hypothetical protein
VQGIAVASTAYLNALEYTRERKQGSSIKAWKDASAPRVAIINHPDVRRMLLDMKSRVEGIRALALLLTSHADRARVLAGKDDAKAAYHQGQIDLLVPLVKAYGSDQAFRICETAIQTYGGFGYTKDYPVEQYCRDAKIFSIYEGTNHIQAMDLVGRKLGQNGGANFQAFMSDIGAFVDKNRDHPVFGKEVLALSSAAEAVVGTAMGMMGWSQGSKLDLVPLSANRMLLMMSQLAVSYLLLDAGVLAEAKLAKLPAGDADRSFYEGKRYSALWYARNVLPQVENHAKITQLEDETPSQIPDAAFVSA